ncbi:Protein kinase alk2 [Podila epigama]|nr:Protein kinase alk2 [Podila epigama]
MATTPLTQVSQMHDRFHALYGPTYSYSMLGLGRVIMSNDPASIEHVLKNNFWAYEKGPKLHSLLQDLLGEGIFNADGHLWKWQRKMASHIFNVKAFRDYTERVFVQESNVVCGYFDKMANTGAAVDVHDIFLKFTLDSFGEVSFGQSFGCLVNPEEEVEFAAAFDRLNAIVGERLFRGPWEIYEKINGIDKQVEKDKKIVVDFALNVIRHRREIGYDRPQKDLLQLFMDLKGDDGEPLSDEMLKDSILNFIIAGRDTTAQALTWMFYLMHRDSADKNIVHKLREEIDNVLGDDMPSYETTKAMKYAEACLYEALRLYPSVPRNIKVCVEDDVLPNGVEIKKGEFFQWSSWTMGRATEIWGPDAKEYRPERWLDGTKNSPTKFPAFHAGPRTCLGQQFATIEAITIMSLMFKRFNFELVDPSTEPAYASGLTLPVAQGLPVRITKRNQTAVAV